MGGQKETVKYVDTPPADPIDVETQSLRTQLALNKVANEQQRLNMRTGAQLDRVNAEFFATQDVRKLQTAGAEERLSTMRTGQETRATERVRGEEQRAGIRESGGEQRETISRSAEETRATDRVRGEEQRAGIRETGSETRLTDLQREMFRRYKENRDFEQAQGQYRA